MTLWKWSQVAATNATVDSTIFWAEGQAPSSVNDSARAMMAAVSKYRDDTAGSIVTGVGTTSVAYLVTTSQNFTGSITNLSNQMLGFVPSVTNTAGSPSVTLNVDSTGAKPIRLSPGIELPAGTLVQGTPYVVTYNNTDGAFYLQGLGFGNPYNIPLGGMLPYTASTAPNSSFVFPMGQALARSVYATYFALIGTNYQTTADGTHFNVPDLSNRIPVCWNDGTGTTRVSLNISGTTIGASGGVQQLVRSALPNTTAAVTITDSNPATGDPSALIGANAAAGIGAAFVSTGVITGTTHSLNGSLNLNNNVTQTTSMPPTLIVPYILRVI